MATRTASVPVGGLSGSGNPRVSLGITLGAHERPTAVTITGTVFNSNHDIWYNFTPALCDTGGGNSHSLGTVNCPPEVEASPGVWVVNPKEVSGCSKTASPANEWSNLRGKALALKKVRSDSITVGAYQGLSLTITTSVHALSWSGANLSFSQNEYTLTVTRAGYASDNWSGSVTYRLYMDGVDKGTFSGNSKTITLTDSDLERAHSFKLVASGTADGDTITADGTTKGFTPKSVHKTVFYYDGTEWVECIPYYYDGTAWQEVQVYWYDGTAWQLCSKT